MASGCPKCGCVGNRVGGQYICPICDNRWNTEATDAAIARSEFQADMRRRRSEFDSAYRDAMSATDDFRAATRELERSQKEYALARKAAKKPVSFGQRIVTGIIFAVLGQMIFGAGVIGFIAGFIFA